MYIITFIFRKKKGYTIKNDNFFKIINLTGVYSKKKDYARLESKFFPFWRDPPFQQGFMCMTANWKSQKCLPRKNGGKSTKCIQSP